MSDLSIPAVIPNELLTLKPGWLARHLSRVLLSRIKIGRLTIVTPSGMRLSHEADRGGSATSLPANRSRDARLQDARLQDDGPDGVIILRRWRTLRRLLFQGDVSFAEAYIDGDWDSPDLPALIELAGRNMPTLTDAIDATVLQRLRNRLIHRMNANTKRGSRRNISHHYDLGNSFYRTWLDDGMSYSSALFTGPDQTLEDAQVTKQDRTIKLMELNGGERVLEIGCGWGGLAERLVSAAGCHVTGVTLSPAQLEYAAARLQAPELQSRSDVRLQDYRDVAGRFDRIVSIEMMEAVGEAYWPAYFGALRDRLRPDGRAVIQAITIAEDKFEEYKRCPDFIQRYIFPGGMLPTITEIRRQAAQAGLLLRSIETFGASYARTLAEWRRRFHVAWPEIQRQGFDHRFQRMWDYYLAYCEGGFRAGAIDVGLYVMDRPA